jgi:hypothetical protein
MHQKKILLPALLIVAVVLVVAAILVVKYAGPDQEKKTEREEIVVFEVQEEEVSSLSIQNKEDSYRFVKSEAGGFVPESSDITIASGKYDDLFINAFKLCAYTLVEDFTDEPQKYGFDNPNAKLSIELANGQKHEFIVGKQTFLSNYYYFWDCISGKVYTISSYRAGIFMRKLGELRQDPLPSVNPNFIESFSLITPGKQTIRASMQLSELSANWILEEPYVRSVNGGKIQTEIVEKIVKIKAEDIVASQVKDLSAYGLLVPAHTLIYKVKDEEPVTLHFGNTTSSKVYFKIGDGNIVYQCDKKFLSLFDIDPIGLTDRLGYTVNITDVTQMLIVSGNKKYEIFIDEDQKQYSINGVSVDESPFKKLYRTLNSFTIVRMADSNSSQESIYTMYVTKKDGTQDTVLVKPLSGRECLLSVNGNTDFVISRLDVDTMLTELAAF